MLLSHFVMVGTVLAQNTTSDEERDAVPVDREQLERAATTAIENCAVDIEQFCIDVTSGESRMLACLQAYADKVSPTCTQSLSKWRRPDVKRDFHTTQIYPTLENRDLGEPNLMKMANVSSGNTSCRFWHRM